MAIVSYQSPELGPATGSESTGGLFGRSADVEMPEIVRGEGVMLWDNAGNGYYDSSSGAISVVSIGHGVDEVIDAMADQARKVAYAQGGRFRNPAAEELAKELARFAPGDLNRVYFISGGSEGVETAIKLARQYQVLRGHPDRHIVLSRNRSYHGNTLGALSLSGYTQRRDPYIPLLLDSPKVAESNCYRCPFDLIWPGCELACTNDLERAIEEIGADQVSAFIAEPIVAAAGAGTTPPPGYFERVRQICDAHDILFIADEVVTGMGRTGANFGIDHWGVVPDMIVTAKGLGGGYMPLGAVLISDRIEQAFIDTGQRFMHGHTYMQHPVACAAGLAVVRIIERDRLVENAANQGAYLFERLHGLAEDIPYIGDIRGKGLLAGVELVADRDTRQPFNPELQLSARLVDACLAQGVMVYPCNSGEDSHSDQFLVSPPLCVTGDEIDEITDRLAQALEDVLPV